MEAGKMVIMAVVMGMMMVETARGVTLCNMNDNGLEACKPSVTKGGNPVDPSPGCCQALKGADLSCLCSYKKSPMLPALGIDPDLALSLPPKCNIPLPQGCH